MTYLINRRNQGIIEKSSQSPFVTALLGPRRVGKSTLLMHLTKHIPASQKLYLNMDRLEERNILENANAGLLPLQVLIEQRLLKKLNQNANELIWVIIDEAQKCPPVFEQIKVLYNQYKDQRVLKFILSGSSSLSLHQLSAESLAGRIQLFNLREFNLQETCALTKQKEIPKISILENLIFSDTISITAADIHASMDELNPYRAALIEALQMLLVYGGLPEVLQLSTPIERLQYLANYLQTYLEKDVLAVQTVSDLNLYQKLMRVIAEQTGSLRDDQKIVNALQCARETIKKYRNLLATTLMYEEVFPYINSSLKRLVKSPKGYLLNNGLISFLSNIHDLSLLEKTGLVGHRFENWFLQELRIILDRNPYNAEIYYWRTSAGSEVDFVLDMQQCIIPFEVTYQHTVEAKKVNSLKGFLRDEKKAKFGVIIYNGEFRYDMENRIYFLPAWTVG